MKSCELVLTNTFVRLFLVVLVYLSASNAWSGTTVNSTNSTFSINFNISGVTSPGIEQDWTLRSYDPQGTLVKTEPIGPSQSNKSFTVTISGRYRYELWLYECYEDPYDSRFDTCTGNRTPSLYDTFYANVALPPNVPGAISFSSNEGGVDRDGKFTVNWGAASTSKPVTGYQLQQEANLSSSWSTIYSQANLNIRSVQVPSTGKLPNGSYRYRVRSFVNISGVQNYSAWRTSSSLTVNRVPDTVSNFTQPTGGTQSASFSVAWQPVTGAFDSVTKYELQCSINGGAFTYNNCGSSNLGTANVYSVSLSAGTQGEYRFRARACNGIGCSAWTGSTQQKIVSVNVPLPTPTNVAFIDFPESSEFGDYDIRWSASGTVTSYHLEQECMGGVSVCGVDGFHNIPLSTATATSYFARGQVQGLYRYRIQACNNSECSSWVISDYISVHNLEGIAPAVSVLPATSPGSSLYAASVNRFGDGVISVPFKIAPGVNGHEPNIGLMYSDGRRRTRISDTLPEDILGYGWRLSGFSEIRRCVTNQPSGARIELDGSDSLCLDGEPLVLISGSGTHLSDGALYRTLRDSFQLIQFHDESNRFDGEVTWFSVHLPSGEVREYGRTRNSRLNTFRVGQVFGGPSPTFGWSITKSTDTFGNEINYSYYKDLIEGINYPAAITYGNNNDARVEFLYGTRSDAPPQPFQPSTADGPQQQLVLLHTVNIYIDNTLIREYRLVTEEEPADPGVEHYRRLQQIQECGYDSNGSNRACLNPLVLTWDEVGSGNDFDIRTGVSQITDGVGASARFIHTLMTDSSSVAKFEERPFGEGILPPDVSVMTPIDGQYRCVVSELWQSNGLSSQWNKTEYDYQGVGLVSDRNWGFLGYYAQRVRDVQSNVVTYRQYRMDFPFYTQLSRQQQYEGDLTLASQTLGLSQIKRESLTLGMPNGAVTYFPYISEAVGSVFEQNQIIGYSLSESSFDTESTAFGEVLLSSSSVQKVVTSGTLNNSQSFWGDVKPFNVSEVSRSTRTEILFENLDDPWLIGFAVEQNKQQFQGDVDSDLTRSQMSVAERLPGTNRVSSVTSMPGDANYELTINYDYDSFGNLTTQSTSGVNVEPRTASLSDFVDGRYPGITENAFHQTQEIEYDKRFGFPIYVNSINDKSTGFNYDQFGRLIRTTDQFNVVTDTSYEFCTSGTCPVTGQMLASYKVTTDSPISPSTTQIFDNLNRLIQARQESFDGSKTINVEYNYDDRGRLFLETAPFFDGDQKPIYSYTFDIRNRITQALRPDLSKIKTEYKADPVNAAILISNIEDVLNTRGQLIKQQRQDSLIHLNGDVLRTTDAVGSPEQVITDFSYDGSGLLTQVMVDNNLDTITTFEYDQLGNRTQISGPNIGIVSTSYNALGEVLNQTDNKNQTISYQYDLLGRLLKQTDPDGVSEWSYDPTNGAGFIAEARYTRNGQTSPDYLQTFNYNGENLLAQITTNLRAGGFNRTYNESYSYDSFGRIKSTTYPNGSVINYGFNSIGSLNTLTNNGSTLKTYSRVNARGQIEQESFGNGTRQGSQYSSKTGLVESLSLENFGEGFYRENYYFWSSNGNLIAKGRTSDAAYSDLDEEYEYDGLNRLVRAADSYGSAEQNFVYDKLGNIQRKLTNYPNDIGADNYQYGQGNAGPNAVTTVSINNIQNQLEYDANGAVTRYDAAVGDDRFIAWNARQLPTAITVGASATTTAPTARDKFSYGPDGQRFYRESTWTDESTGQLHTERAFIVGSYEDRLPANDPTYNRVQRVQVDTSIEIVTATQHSGLVDTSIEYIHRDHLGSVDVVTDENGDILVPSGQYSFDAFGQRRSTNWLSALDSNEQEELLENIGIRTRRGFTGHEHLDRTGLIHMNGRIYDPVLGRFLSPDPIVQAPSFSQNWNRYSYVFNNPLNAIDPSGFVITFTESFSVSTNSQGMTEITVTATIIDSGFSDFDLSATPEGFPLSISDEQFDDNADLVPNRGAGSAVANRSSAFDISQNFISGLQDSLVDSQCVACGVAFAALEAVNVVFIQDIATTIDATIAGNLAGAATGLALSVFKPAKVFDRLFPGAKKFLNRGGCFVAGTLVHTSEGLKPIEEIEVGDLVAAKETIDGEVQWKPVTELYVYENKEVLHITFTSKSGDIETISATPEHPFWVVGQGWTTAGNLVVSDIITDKDGIELNVSSISKDPERHTTYNFEVADFHTYFVGEQGVWVHNECDVPKSGLQRAEAARDAKLNEISQLSNTQRDKVSTVVGAHDPATGKVAVGVKRTGCDIGKCAEDLAAEALGNPNPKTIEFTKVIRPRNEKVIPRCDRCTNTFGPE